MRVCTRMQNSQNRKLNKNSKSGLKGVFLFKNHGYVYWRAAINHKGKVRPLGLFKDKYEAKKVYDAEAKKLFGEFYSP